MVTQLQKLAIEIPRGVIGTSQVRYWLDDCFFYLFDNSLLEKGEFIVDVKLEKTSRHIQLLFQIEGSVELLCDKSLEQFAYPIFIEEIVYFKLGPESKEIDLNLYMIKETDSVIDLTQHIYDFVTLSIPMRKIHPRFRTE